MESIWKIAEKRKAECGIVKIDNEAVSKNKNISEASSLMKKWGDCSWISAVEKHWDVIVIGAGMAGILTAWYLQQERKQVLVLEAKEVASGQTQNTTAKITSQHGLKYQKLIHTVGRKKALLYAQANEQAIDEYEKLIGSQKIDCDFERLPAYLYSKQKEDVLRKEAQAAASLGIRARFMKGTEWYSGNSNTEKPEILHFHDKNDLAEIEKNFQIRGAVYFENQAQFSPLKFISAIAKDLNVLEHTEVLSVKGQRVITKEQVFTAEKIVMATHYPFRNVPGFYFLRQHQERSYVLALEGCKPIHSMYYGIDANGLSLRQAGEYLLLGGSSHRTGKNKAGGAYEFLENAALHNFPEGTIKAKWSAQDCMPHDGIPFIGKFSVFTPHLYVAAGFQKWGMSTSMVAAMLLRDEICGCANPYKTVFRPWRLNLRASIANLLSDIWVSICGLSKGFIRIFYRKAPRCPHMGCALTWNPDEKSWDCPCHGSRFDEHGRLLDNPAQNNLDTE